jgi:putative hydrolase of the HAD superfamily
MRDSVKQTIIFDLDDTLIHCNKYFYLVINRFADWMVDRFRPYGLEKQRIIEKQMEIDIARVEQKGFAGDHFPQSLVDTYNYYCDWAGIRPSVNDTRNLWQLGQSVYKYKTEPYPGMEATLQSLTRQGHELHLYTGGEPEIQRQKIRSHKLERFFGERIYIRRHKNEAALDEILSSGRFDRSRTWMVGNSLRTDVLPAIRNGIHAIYLKAEQEWSFNIVEIHDQPKGALLKLASLRHVPKAISEYAGLRTVASIRMADLGSDH